MLKKTFLIVASAAVLAACTTQPAPYTENGEYVTGVQTGSSATPSVLSGDRMLADNVTSGHDGSAVGQHLAATASDRVFFNFDSASLSPKAQDELKQIASFIKSNKSDIHGITIEGHCDERGTREYNLALGERRAVAAKKYLVGMGIKANTISTISYGKERPVDPAHNEAAWAKNRRAVVVLR